MYERESAFQSRRFLPKLQPVKGIFMQSQVKNAIVTTGIVLATIYVLNKISFTRPVVQTALA